MASTPIDSGLFDLCANPERYAVELHGRVVAFGERGVDVRLLGDHVEMNFAWDGRRRMIYIPTAGRSLAQLDSVAEAVGYLFDSVEVVRFCRVRSVARRNYSFRVDILVCDVADGEPLSEYAARLDRSQVGGLYLAISAFEDRMRECDLSLDGLVGDDLVVGGDGTLSLRRLRGVKVGCGAESYRCCDALRRWLSDLSGMALPKGVALCDDRRERADGAPVDGHLWCGVPHEERIAVRDEGGYGFVDSDNCVVVESKFRSVTNFGEGRAVVRSDRGYGLIDVWGNFVIEDRYDDMAYSVSSGVTVAKLDGLWCRFDYCGAMISEFVVDYPAEALADALCAVGENL